MKKHLFILTLGLCFLMNTQAQTNKLRLNDGWKFVKGDLGGVWEAVPFSSE